jgi:hypothetical protein
MSSSGKKGGSFLRDRLVASPLLLWFVLASGALVAEAGDEFRCFLQLVETHITDNGDGDGLADTNETLQIGMSLEPRCAGGLSNCVARISTESPAIECMRRTEILIGDLPESGPAVTPDETFEIKIGEIDRNNLGLGPDDPLEASLFLTIHCGGLYSRRPDEIVLPLDLNMSDLGQTPTPWLEDFEGDTLGKFSPQNNDAGMPGANNAEGLVNADGWRCQFSDPDWINSETYMQANAEDCFPGASLAQANAVFWQVDGAGVAASPDGGRAKSGTRSMYYGIFIDQPASDMFTTPVSTVEAVGTTAPVNLGIQAPKLSFWQQVSLMDYRILFNPRPGESLDRGVVQIQLTDEMDATPGSWANLSAVVNPYNSTVAENHFACTFDPIDDGNTEDDFFDPTEPSRELGPSSTCVWQWVWSFQGDTSENPFDVANVGHATTPPESSDAPSLGTGTWVRSEVDLSRFRGRLARFRFLVTSIKLSAETYHDQFGDNGSGDDGWWIDDIVVDETLAEPAVFSNDAFLLGSCSGTGEPCIGQCRLSLAPCSDTEPCDAEEGDCVIPCPPGDVCAGPPPDCGANCTEAQLNIFVEPDGPLNPASVTTSEPDEQVTLNFRAPVDPQTGAEPSWVDACIDGGLEFRFCISGDPDGDGPLEPDADCDDPSDGGGCATCVPQWWVGWMLFPSPDVVTTYAVEMRCSSVPGCTDGRTIEIFVECPSGSPNTMGLREIRALDRQTLSWRGVLDVDWLRGSFSSSAEIGNYDQDFTDVGSAVTSIPMTGDPPSGAGYYYLVKADGPVNPFLVDYFCDTVTWRSGGDAESTEPARNVAFGNP